MPHHHSFKHRMSCAIQTCLTISSAKLYRISGSSSRLHWPNPSEVQVLPAPREGIAISHWYHKWDVHSMLLHNNTNRHILDTRAAVRPREAPPSSKPRLQSCHTELMFCFFDITWMRIFMQDLIKLMMQGTFSRSC